MLKHTLERYSFAQPGTAVTEIDEFVESIFGPVEGEVSPHWTFAADEDLDPTVEAMLLRQARASNDPLAELANTPILRTRLDALLRQRWAARNLRAAGFPAELSGLSWADLNAANRDMVQSGIAHLEAIARHSRRRGPHQNHPLDTFLNELAEIYARHTGFTYHQLKLPSSENSRFVQLAVEVLRPAGVLTQNNPEAAIAQRWKRYKRTHHQD